MLLKVKNIYCFLRSPRANKFSMYIRTEVARTYLQALEGTLNEQKCKETVRDLVRQGIRASLGPV